jgi:hypothetical protein
VEELDSLERMAESAGTPWSVSKRVTEVHRSALTHFGDVDGELLGAAWLEHLAGHTLADRTTRASGSGAHDPDDGRDDQRREGRTAGS